MSDQDEAVRLLNELLNEKSALHNAAFKNMLDEALYHFNEASLGFNSLLLQPVQRLPRYLLLLKGTSTVVLFYS